MKRLFLTILTLVIIAAVAGYFLIQPVRALDLSYKKVSWSSKVQSAIQNLGTVTITEDELASLLKEQLSKQRTGAVTINGADVDLQNGRVHVYINLQKGPVPAGIHMEGTLTHSAHTITVTPVAYTVGRIPMSPDTFERLVQSAGVSFRTPFTFDLSQYLTSDLAIKSIQVQQNQLQMSVVPKFLQ